MISLSIPHQYLKNELGAAAGHILRTEGRHKIEVATLVEKLDKGRGDSYERGTDEEGKLKDDAVTGRRCCGGRVSASAGSKAGKRSKERH
jgi:hypothetical protein